MTVKQIAASEQVSERQIQRYCSVGYQGHILKATKSGRSLRIELDDYKQWRLDCGFDFPVSTATPIEPSEPSGSEPTRTVECSPSEGEHKYPPWPQAADPNGVLTNQPHEHSRNWPHPLAQQDHEREQTRKAMEQWRGYPDESDT